MTGERNNRSFALRRIVDSVSALTMLGKYSHAVLRRLASNVAEETDAAVNLKPSKKKSTERIDGIVAAIMAVGRVLQDAPFVSVYETRGLGWVQESGHTAIQHT